jgi:hypothetical protein
VAGFSRELDRPRESTSRTPIGAYGVDLRVDHPVLVDAHTFVQPALDRLVALRVAGEAISTTSSGTPRTCCGVMTSAARAADR